MVDPLLSLFVCLSVCLSVLSEDNRILMWDIRRASGPLATFDQHNGANRSVSSSGKSKPEECTRVCVHVCTCVHMCVRQSNLSLVPCPVVTAHSGIVTGVRYTHDGLFVVSCGSDDRVKLWDGTTGRNTMVCVA